jgi:hypothetical protein
MTEILLVIAISCPDSRGRGKKVPAGAEHQISSPNNSDV